MISVGVTLWQPQGLTLATAKTTGKCGKLFNMLCILSSLFALSVRTLQVCANSNTQECLDNIILSDRTIVESRGCCVRLSALLDKGHRQDNS